MQTLGNEPAKKKDEVAELNQRVAGIKREANAKINGLESWAKRQEEDLGKKAEELQAARKLLDERVSELNRLWEEMEKKRSQSSDHP